MDHSNSSFISLSICMVLEILLKLPVKTLGICCCVCKSWKSLIRTDNFINLHLKQSLEYNPNNFNEVIIQPEFQFRWNHMWYIPLLAHVYFVGCSNGILCYYRKCSFSNSIIVYLWNPVTRYFRSLPDGYYKSTRNKRTIVLFSFDSSNDDYIVVKLFSRSYKNFIALEGEVYSLRTNSWKVINSSSLAIRGCIGRNIAFHNRALHCIGTSVSTSNIVLGTFYMDEARYVECALPCINFKRDPMPRLESFDQFLSLSFWREEFEVWVMKEYGAWSKMFVFAKNQFVHSPIGVTKTGKLLALNWNGEEVVYDPMKKSIEKYAHNKAIFLRGHTNHTMPIDNHESIVEYVESMISAFPPSGETWE